MASGSREAKRKKRGESDHPGVVLVARATRAGPRWRARYADPEDRGRTKWVTLDPRVLPNAAARTRWAKDKSKWIARRRLEIENGINVPVQRTEIEAALARFLDGKRDEGLADATLASYSTVRDVIFEWAKRERITHVQDIDFEALSSFRRFVARRRVKISVKGAKRGTRATSTKAISDATFNSYVRQARVVFGALRRQLDGVDRDDIREALKARRECSEPTPLGDDEVRKLVEASLAHDEVVRASEDGRTQGRTLATPVVLFYLLSGMRLGEGLGLRWADVSLEAFDDGGNQVGAIQVRARTSKTRRLRAVWLGVSPMLRRVLRQMKAVSRGAFVLGGRAPLGASTVDRIVLALREKHGAPTFSPQILRQTCATILVNAPGVLRQNVRHAARQLGHSTRIAEANYWEHRVGIDPSRTTIEDVVGIAEHEDRVLALIGGPRAARAKAVG